MGRIEPVVSSALRCTNFVARSLRFSAIARRTSMGRRPLASPRRNLAAWRGFARNRGLAKGRGSSPWNVRWRLSP